MQKVKILEIPAELVEPTWQTNKVTIRRLKYHEKMKIVDEAVPATLTGREVHARVSQETIAVSTIVKAVEEAPWPIKNPEIIRELDWALGEWLLKEIDELNSLSSKKKVSSNDVSEPTE